MTTRVIHEEPTNTVVQRDSSNSGTSIMLMTLVALIVVLVAVLVILHFTVGVA
jgi:uncharacterized protein HemY